MDLGSTKGKHLTSVEVMYLADGAEILGGAQCSPGNVERYIELSMVDARTADVVVVVVRDNQGMDLVDVPSVLVHSQLGLFSTDAGIEEQASVGGLDIDAVAV